MARPAVAEFGFAAPPETFPKQRWVEAGKYGNWFRVVGRRHTQDHWPRVWEGASWLAGDAAVDHVLALPKGDPALIPAEALSAGAVDVAVPTDVAAGDRRPGADFDRRGGESAAGDLLRGHGWTLAGRRGGVTEWTRPGKAGGRSGTLGYGADAGAGVRFYCFSSNAPPLEAGRSYSPFALLAALDHGGDYRAAAAALRAKGYGGTGLTEAAGGEEPPDAPAVEILVAIGSGYQLWHDPKQAGYASRGRRSIRIRSPEFRRELTHQYRIRTGKVPNGDALTNATNALEAAAVQDGAEHPVHVRVACHDGRVYLHLADASDTVIEIDGGGWRACADPPVRFRRPDSMRPLPAPERGGELARLRDFLNVPDDNTFALVVAWLAGCFCPDAPSPLLVLSGEQGAAKSTTGRLAKLLVDPSAAPMRSEPREVRELMIQAGNNRILAYDNLSHLSHWLSDALCRLATGGGFAARGLYTDDSEVIFEARRPVTLNGIEDFVTRPDLLERALLIRHPPIPEERRRPEGEFWAAFEAARPRLLGALLDRVSGGLRELPGVHLDRLPRMADFARFAVACERGAGEPPRFEAAYASNQAGAHEQALDVSPLPAAVLRFMTTVDGDTWEGPPTELLRLLDPFAPNPVPRDWPKRANVLTNHLRRLAPDLRRVHGLDVNCDSRASGGRSGGGRTRLVRIAHLPPGAGGGSSPIAPPAEVAKSAARGAVPPGDGPPLRRNAPAPGDRPPTARPGNSRAAPWGDDGGRSLQADVEPAADISDEDRGATAADSSNDDQADLDAFIQRRRTRNGRRFRIEPSPDE